MTPREMKAKLEALKPKLEGWAEPFSELTDVVKGLLEVIEAMLAEQAAERVRKGGF